MTGLCGYYPDTKGNKLLGIELILYLWATWPLKEFTGGIWLFNSLFPWWTYGEGILDWEGFFSS
jgi:hypothetical protein